LSAEGEVSIEMEKVLKSLPNSGNVKADKILEINPRHPVFQALKAAHENDREKLKLYTNLLYNQALLIEGLTVDDPVQFADDICRIMV
jgi:molecular chaperone HtpG